MVRWSLGLTGVEGRTSRESQDGRAAGGGWGDTEETGQAESKCREIT